MFKLDFKENSTLSLGVEIEIQLIHPQTGDLFPVGPDILNFIDKSSKNPRIKSEIFQSMLEIDTPICQDAFEVGSSLRDSLSELRKAADHFQAKIMMAGTHPTAHYSERLLTPSGRYYSLVDRNQWIARRLQIFGLHVHIGMKNGEHAIAMNNALCHYLPMILALSASSPFWDKEDTGLASSRITFFEAIPTGGHPYLLENWEAFENLVQRLIASKSITAIKDLWWDIRPNLEFGTIEIRIADCPPTIKEAEALVALIHGLAIFIDQELSVGRRFAPPPEWVLRENKWRASRYGIQCELIRDASGALISLADQWKEMQAHLKPTLDQLGYQPFMKFIDQMIASGPSYLRQRQQADLSAVIQHLIRENETDQPEW